MTKLTNLTLEELEESMEEIFSGKFQIKNTKNGYVIYTFLTENEYGELVPIDNDDDLDEDSMFESGDIDSLSMDDESSDE